MKPMSADTLQRQVLALQSEVATLRQQLQAARAEAKSFVEAGAAIHGQILYVKRESK
jgi:hypothetical protein